MVGTYYLVLKPVGKKPSMEELVNWKMAKQHLDNAILCDDMTKDLYATLVQKYMFNHGSATFARGIVFDMFWNTGLRARVTNLGEVVLDWSRCDKSLYNACRAFVALKDDPTKDAMAVFETKRARLLLKQNGYLSRKCYGKVLRCPHILRKEEWEAVVPDIDLTSSGDVIPASSKETKVEMKDRPPALKTHTLKEEEVADILVLMGKASNV
jgi:hypothetical protein